MADVSLHEAAQRVCDLMPRGPLEWLPTETCLGRILARNVTAPFSIPRCAQSLMDGYAVFSRETAGASPGRPVSLPVRGRPSAAGHPAGDRLTPGTCRRILTGAPLPEGADAVVPQEDVRLQGDRILLNRPARQGQWITVPGEEIKAGEVILHAGDRLTPSRLSLALAAGFFTLPVVRKCRVAVLGTGDELREPGSPLDPASRYGDSRHLIAALARQAGAEPIHLGSAPDDAACIAAALKGAEADLVITTGGAGRGDRDFLLQAWARLGLRPLFSEIGIRPGHGTACAATSSTLYFALPGGPLAAEIIFHELVLPALQTWHQSSEGYPERVFARLNTPVRNDGPALRAVTGTASFRETVLWFQPFGKDRPTRHFSRRRLKNAYALIPPLSGTLDEGQTVPIRFFLGHCPVVHRAP